MTSTYVIEVRRQATQRRPKYFQSAPNRHGHRIRLVSQVEFARQFASEVEAQAVSEYLATQYTLTFTARQKDAH